MDSSDEFDNSKGLSISLVSYGSDVQVVDSSFNESYTSADGELDPTVIGNVCNDSTIDLKPSSSSSEEDDLILSVAQQLGLSGVTHKKLDELNTAMDKMKAAQQKYVQKKAVFDAVVAVAKTPSKVPLPTAQRINQALQHISLLDYVTPPEGDTSESASGIFGVSKKDLDEQIPITLTVVDKKHLRNAVEKELSSKQQTLNQLDKRFSDMMLKVSGPTLPNCGNVVEQKDTHDILSLRKDLDLEMAINLKLIESLDQTLCDLARLKVTNLESVTNDRLNQLCARCDSLKQHLKSLNLQIMQGIYLEDKHLIDAYTKLKQTLDVALEEVRNELCHLQKRDEEYEKLSGTHFDTLVKEYNQLKIQIAEKEYAMKLL